MLTGRSSVRFLARSSPFLIRPRLRKPCGDLKCRSGISISNHSSREGMQMGLAEVTVIKITCDNPKCPGHPNLDDSDRTGWLFMNYEIYGQPSQQGVFGSADCVAQAASDVEAAPTGEPTRVFAGIEPAQTVGMPTMPPEPAA